MSVTAEFARAFRTDRNTRSEKGCLTMYEASEVVSIGAAHEMILGTKPVAPTLDSVPSFGFDEPQNDIDETE